MIDREVADEIVALHDEFEHWFHATSDSLERVEQSLAADFLFVAPSGPVVPRTELVDGLRASRGTAPYRIAIEDVVVRWERGDLIAATYVERHTHLDYTTTRQSSVVLERASAGPGGFSWLSVHETWLVPPPR